MADPDASPATPVKKASKLPLILGLVLALLLGGGGFYATSTGLIFAGEKSAHHGAEAEAEQSSMADIAFVPLEPMVISLGAAAESRHLRFTSQLEVAAANAADVILLQPRILDVLNSYLRAVDVTELEDPTALVRIRSQMLRRIQIVSGEGRVRDLLITEFVLN